MAATSGFAQHRRDANKWGGIIRSIGIPLLRG
jgi:hypothetical protein